MSLLSVEYFMSLIGNDTQEKMSSNDVVRVDNQTGSEEDNQNEEQETSVQESEETSSIDSQESVSSASCRFCMEASEETSKLISPCDCTGSLEFVHFDCIKNWIELSNNDFCPTCQTPYVGLVMTSSRISISTFLGAFPEINKELANGILATALIVYIILIGSMAAFHPYISEGFLSIFKYLIFVFNACMFFRLIVLSSELFKVLKDVPTLYRAYIALHKSYKVTGFEDWITIEANELEDQLLSSNESVYE